MTRLFYFMLLLLTAQVFGQKDTVVYYSKTYRTTNIVDSAFCKDLISKRSNKEFKQISYIKLHDSWEKTVEYIIKIESDSSLIITIKDQKKNFTKRYFHKTDSGYIISDYKNSIIYQTGHSKLLFPIVRDGYWKIFDDKTGKIRIEGFYHNNQVGTNKYWVSETSYIENVFPGADKNPEYKGGERALMEYVYNKIQYPRDALDENISGTVVIGFIVKKDGSLDCFHYITKVHPSIDFEALRVIMSMPRNWTPGEIGGKKVDVVYSLPVTFQIK